MVERDLWQLRQRLERGEAVVAGVLSGTSADGIAVVFARFASAARPGGGLDLLPPEVLAFDTRPFPREVSSRVRSVLDGEGLSLRESALLSRDLGRVFGAAVRALAHERGIEVDLVGSHGQTVYHHDGAEASGPATLQLGDGDFVAEHAGCTVVSDFRQRDIAAGGGGAPISALADELLFARAPRSAAILNLGGMANLTLLPSAAAGSEVKSFDIGPACALLDGLARRFLGRPYDPDGSSARGGNEHAGLLSELERNPFLRQKPPKSTGRDTFGEAWIDALVDRARELGVQKSDREPKDLLATACAFIARNAVEHCRLYAPADTQVLLACGGGSLHGPLLERLTALAPFPVASSAEYGVDPLAREALVFATLAARCILGQAVTMPSATGARAGRVLGKISAAALSG